VNRDERPEASLQPAIYEWVRFGCDIEMDDGEVRECGVDNRVQSEGNE